MIKFQQTNGCHHFWELDNIVFRTSRYLDYDINEVEAYVKNLTEILENDLYKQNTESFSLAVNRFEYVDFIYIAFAVCNKSFLRMFEYFCIKYIEEGKIQSKTTTTKKVPLYKVFQLIMGNGLENSKIKLEPINRAIKRLQCRKNLFDIAERSYDLVWISRIMEAVSRNENLYHISNEITSQKTIEYLGRLEKDVFQNYLLKRMEIFTLERRQMSFDEVISGIIDVQKIKGLLYYDSAFSEALREAMRIQTKLHQNKFCQENYLQMSIENDKWVLYNESGPSLRKTTLDFTDINCRSIAQEFKYFIKWRYEGRGYSNSSFFRSCTIALNALTEINPNIKYFADISETDARALALYLESYRTVKTGAPLSQYSISKSVRCCKTVIDYLMEDMRDKALKTPKPYCNPFASYIFRNLREYNNASQAIPEDVIEQLDKHTGELSAQNKLLYNIFKNTGLRLKEVFFLEYDCIEPSRYDNIYQLKFKPYKTLMARKRKNAGDFHSVLIYNTLADEIKDQIETSAALRKETNLPYISKKKMEFISWNNKP